MTFRFDLGAFLTPARRARLDARVRLREIAPAVARWLRLPEEGRGPRPDVAPRYRREVEKHLEALERKEDR